MNKALSFAALASCLLVACPETHVVRYDGGACPVTCAGETPVCDFATATCVGCVESADCTGAATPICDTETKTCQPCLRDDQCAAGGKLPHCTFGGECAECARNEHCHTDEPYCSPATHTCKGCGVDSDCTDATASRCDTSTNLCVPCQGNVDCGHLAATPLCDTGRGVCVQCTGATEAARCGGNSCRRSDGTCTTTPVGTLSRCAVCQADSECGGVARCVPHGNGYACLPIPVSGQCSLTQMGLRPYSVLASTQSIDGVAADVCAPISNTTCEAIRESGSSCSGDDDCGVEGADDGICTTVSGTPNLCSIPCGFDADCPNGRLCTSVGPSACR